MNQPEVDIDLAQARLDPASVFTSPEELCESAGLSRTEKINLLQRWADDARELEVAEAEGMGGGETSLLARILTALTSLGETNSTVPICNASAHSNGLGIILSHFLHLSSLPVQIFQIEI